MRTTSRVEYRDIPGFPEYRVGSDGSVWSHWTGRWKRLKILVNTKRNNYRHVHLYRGGRCTTRCVHTLVLLAFHGPRPDGCEALHTPNPDPGDNRAVNLRWGTHAENQREAAVTGRMACGERNHFAKLRCHQLPEVQALRAAGLTLEEIGGRYGVSKATVSRLLNGRTWTHESKIVQQM
jgi:hypothetical protein